MVSLRRDDGGKLWDGGQASSALRLDALVQFDAHFARLAPRASFASASSPTLPFRLFDRALAPQLASLSILLPRAFSSGVGGDNLECNFYQIQAWTREGESGQGGGRRKVCEPG